MILDYKRYPKYENNSVFFTYWYKYLFYMKIDNAGIAMYNNVLCYSLIWLDAYIYNIHHICVFYIYTSIYIYIYIYINIHEYIYTNFSLQMLSCPVSDKEPIPRCFLARVAIYTNGSSWAMQLISIKPS